MQILLPLLLFLFVNIPIFSQSEDEKQIKAFYETALTQGKAYDWLNHLATRIGGRLSGSIQAQQAVTYAKQQLDALKLDRIWLQPVKVPRWVRGAPEFAYIEIKPGHTINVSICALGGSVATPKGGIKANVIEVQQIADLATLGRDTIAGKIVFYNQPMDPTRIDTFEAYAEGKVFYNTGATEAAKYGAIGVLMRSMTLSMHDFPHTEAIQYNNTPVANRIPAAAISTEGAARLSATLALNPDSKLYFMQNCRQFPDVTSHNVIGEIRGTQYPNEIIVVGAHLDSWDLGDGAHDNGAGSVQSMEVLRLFKKTEYIPKRTLRVVLFMNKENGFSGGKTYAKTARNKNEKHMFALESDTGGFSPKGFAFQGTEDQIKSLQRWRSLFKPYFIHQFKMGYSGANVQFLKDQGAVLGRLRTDSQRYFDYSHSENDTFNHVNQRELALGAATMAGLVYLVDKYGVSPNFNSGN